MTQTHILLSTYTLLNRVWMHQHVMSIEKSPQIVHIFKAATTFLLINVRPWCRYFGYSKNQWKHKKIVAFTRVTNFNKTKQYKFNELVTFRFGDFSVPSISIYSKNILFDLDFELISIFPAENALIFSLKKRENFSIILIYVKCFVSCFIFFPALNIKNNKFIFNLNKIIL